MVMIRILKNEPSKSYRLQVEKLLSFNLKLETCNLVTFRSAPLSRNPNPRVHQAVTDVGQKIPQ